MSRLPIRQRVDPGPVDRGGRPAGRAVQWLVAAAVLLGGCGARQVQAPCEAPVVLAASVFRDSLAEAADRYEAERGCRPALSFGATGALAAQLKHGVQADLFLAADPSYVDQLVEVGALRSEGRVQAGRGRLVLVAAPGRELPTSLDALLAEDVRYVAVGHPRHAPYGVAARQALQAAGHLDALERRLVVAASIAQADQLVQTGNADVGLVAQAVAEGRGAPYTLVDEALHAPLVHEAAIPASVRHLEAARALLALLIGPSER